MKKKEIIEQVKKIHKNYRYIEKPKIRRTRTTEQIIKEKYITGCTDCALIFIKYCNDRGWKTRYVETIAEEYLKGKQYENDEIDICGHVFVKVLSDEWIIIDPTNPTDPIKKEYEREGHKFIVLFEKDKIEKPMSETELRKYLKKR